MTDPLPPPTEYEPPPPLGAGSGATGAPPTEQDDTPPALPGADPRGDTSQPPAALRARYEPLERLRTPDGPAQAAVYRVRDRQEGEVRVLKWYHRGYGPDPRVREILLGEPLPHVTHLLDAGQIDGHPYEVAPSHGNTDLNTYLHHLGGQPASPDLLRALIKQQHAALSALHGLGIVHRDVSPANIVLSSLDPADLHLTLIDLGGAVPALRDSRRAHDAPRVGTPAYMSVEATAPRPMVHPASDWWSLGMIIAELAGGRHPLRHRDSDAPYVYRELLTRPPDLSRVTDPRLLLLCRGLLTRDPDERWGGEQVARWLAGDAPPVAHDQGDGPSLPQGVGAAFTFVGQDHTDPVALGRAFHQFWGQFEHTLRDRRARGGFLDWLRQFLGSPGYNAAEREELAALVAALDRRSAPSSDVLVRLLTWLAPGLPPGFRGELLAGPEELTELADRAESGEAHALAVIAETARHPILPSLATRHGAEGLATLDASWRALRRRWRPAVEALCRELPAMRDLIRDDDALRPLLRQEPEDDPTLLAQLLRVAAAPERCRALLDQHATTRLAQAPEPLDWYTRLLRDRRDPLRLLLADRLGPLAEEVAWQARAERLERDAERRLEAEFRWAAEWLERQELPGALAWACAGAAVITLPWLFLIGLSDVLGWAPQRTVVTAWAWAVPAAMATFAMEMWAAYRFGALTYRRTHALARHLVDVSGRLARPARQHRLLATVVLGGCCGVLLLGLLVAAWVWPAVTVLAMAVWTWRRRARWRAQRAAADRPPPAPFPPSPEPPTPWAGIAARPADPGGRP